MIFANRQEAGKALAYALKKYRQDAVIYALPRGGVEVAAPVAKALGLPLELLISRKIGHPHNLEFAVCAVTETGPLLCSDDADVDPKWLKEAEAKERAEAKRRRETYAAGHKPLSCSGRTAIIVDDGIATGLTMRAAVEAIKEQQPHQIIVAVPVAPLDSVMVLRSVADDVIVLDDPNDFMGAVGSHYEDFPQLSDEDVITLMERAKR